LMPPRQALYDLCDARFDAMIANGACEEVCQLGARSLDPSLPAMRALGVAELLAAEFGDMELGDAVARAKMGTRRYAKRQSTWFRNQVSDAMQIEGFGFDEASQTAITATNQFLLTQKASLA
ncbi:MAG: hypothetical protein ACKVH7_16215, partial [Alphaproteobacteria bacterium]